MALNLFCSGDVVNIVAWLSVNVGFSDLLYLAMRFTKVCMEAAS